MRETRSIAVAIMMGVASATVLVWVALPSHPSPSDPNCGSYSSGSGGPHQVQIAWAPLSLHVIGSNHWYNSTISWAVGGLTVKNLEFRVQHQGDGSIVLPGQAWGLVAVNTSGMLVGQFSTNGTAPGTWASPTPTQLVAGMSFSLLTAPESVSGDSFTTIQVGASTTGCAIGGTYTTLLP